MRQLHLFDDIPVTLEDIDIWLRFIGVALDAARRDYYVRAWSVVDKIREAKQAGRWPPE